MQLRGDRLTLSRNGRPLRPWRVVTYSSLILIGVAVLWLMETGRVQPLFLPTYTPTRSAGSYAEEGRAYFSAGALGTAIPAYQRAADLEPGNGRLWAELARIQTYASALMTTAEDRQAALAEARQAIDRAAEVSPDDSFVFAIRALVYDWSASAEGSLLEGGRRDEFLTTALAASARALTIAPGDPLATAFKAEVDIDQQNFVLALDESAYAAGLADPADPYSMDIFRVYGTVLENNGQYSAAIQQYLNAAEIAPNFTYLYLLIGANYRRLAGDDPLSTGRQDLINQALDYVDRAARINEQLGIQDPTPYLAIGRTYLQQGEFFIAAINIEHALAISPDDPDIYGRLGTVFFRARNYESAVVALQCAVDGCGPEVSVQILCEYVYNCDPDTEEGQALARQVSGLALRDETLEYYYTYGSELVYCRDTADFPNACVDSDRIFQALLNAYPEDAVVGGIAAENRALCHGELPTPEGTAIPDGMPTPVPTQTPGP